MQEIHHLSTEVFDGAGIEFRLTVTRKEGAPPSTCRLPLSEEAYSLIMGGFRSGAGQSHNFSDRMPL